MDVAVAVADATVVAALNSTAVTSVGAAAEVAGVKVFP